MNNNCCFKHTDDNVFINTVDNTWVKCTFDKQFRDRKTRIELGKPVDKTQARPYYRRPYYDGWSGGV